MASSPVFLALGSNLGAREATLAAAREALSGVRIVRSSSLYQTEPVGGPPQRDYLNQVVAGETTLPPEELLLACQALEARFGRVRRVRNGPRTLDVDILFYGDLVHESPGLRIPHPRLHERRFVLVPLVEIAPELVHPRLRMSARGLLALCEDRSQVLLHAGIGAAR